MRAYQAVPPTRGVCRLGGHDGDSVCKHWLYDSAETLSDEISIACRVPPDPYFIGVSFWKFPCWGKKKRKRKERKRRRKRRRKRKGQRGGGEGERGEGGILACVPQVDSRKFPYLLNPVGAVAFAAAAVGKRVWSREKDWILHHNHHTLLCSSYPPTPPSETFPCDCYVARYNNNTLPARTLVYLRAGSAVRIDPLPQKASAKGERENDPENLATSTDPFPVPNFRPTSPYT